ncbi:hypothetical protein [Rhodanobacter lindaniclasticus]
MRARQLHGRQFRDIEQHPGLAQRPAIHSPACSPARDRRGHALQFPAPVRHPPDAATCRGARPGLRARTSNNAEVALRGIALWLAVAYHETKTATQPDLQAQHRQLLQLLRELKEIHGNSTRDDTVDSWMQESAVA